MSDTERNFDYGLRGAREAIQPRARMPVTPPEPAERDGPVEHRSAGASAFADAAGQDLHPLSPARQALLRGRGRRM